MSGSKKGLGSGGVPKGKRQLAASARRMAAGVLQWSRVMLARVRAFVRAPAIFALAIAARAPEGVENVPGAIFRRVARVAAGRNRSRSRSYLRIISVP